MNTYFSELFKSLLGKFADSREFAISFVVHVILIVLLGTAVITQVAPEPAVFEPYGNKFVEDRGTVPVTPDSTVQRDVPKPDLSKEVTPNERHVELDRPPIMADKLLSDWGLKPTPPVPPDPRPGSDVSTKPIFSGEMPESVRNEIAKTVNANRKGSKDGRMYSGGDKIREIEFEFTAYIGRYSDGNWHSTIGSIPTNADTPITIGALPNLLYVMTDWSKGKIQTNYTKVRAINLDTDELFAVRPPFIFLTGTKDFVLTEKEVENLQKYIRIGGCIWGDSSVPGLRSAFDIAFRREMRRVIPDVDKKFEPLPPEHPIFSQRAYYTDIKSAPPGINYYNDCVQVMKIYGEIAIIYTSNDYGNMWQFGLTKDGKIDVTTNAENVFVALNPQLWRNRETYVRNISPESLEKTYRFGINVVTHLLTRWDAHTRRLTSPL